MFYVMFSSQRMNFWAGHTLSLTFFLVATPIEVKLMANGELRSQ